VQAHAIAERVENAVRARLGESVLINVHTEPDR